MTPPLSRADKAWLRSAVPVPAAEDLIEIASQSQAVRAVFHAMRLRDANPNKGGRPRGSKSKPS